MKKLLKSIAKLILEIFFIAGLIIILVIFVKGI